MFKQQLLRNHIFNSLRHKSYVRVVEVGPRDGLQNESVSIWTDVKVNFINKLSATGLKSIEVTSFVSPKWVPQMADGKNVYQKITKKPDVSYPVLVPNLKGLNAALEAGVKEIAVFLSASESFSKANINCSIADSINQCKKVTEEALRNNLKIRGYVSCVVGCPYEGKIKPTAVCQVTDALFSQGCYEVSLGDTIGVGTKLTMENMLNEVLNIASPDSLAIHCHDTYGQALVNICVALEKGIKVVDSSVAGLGGCPYAKGATGNVATEDLIYMLHGFGVETGIDLDELIKAGRYISDILERPPYSKVNNALLHKTK